MELDEMAQAIEKLQYQVRTLAEAVDYKAHPIEALILSKNWGEGDIDKTHDIFDKYDKILEGGGAVDHHAMERDFKDALGISYQGLKSVVLAFYRNDQWIEVCRAYVRSHKEGPPVEFNEIARGL